MFFLSSFSCLLPFLIFFPWVTTAYAAGPHLDPQEVVQPEPALDLQPLSDEELLLNQRLLNLIEQKMKSFPEVQKAPVYEFPQFIEKLLSDTERRNPQTLYSLFSDLEENQEQSQLFQRFRELPDRDRGS